MFDTTIYVQRRDNLKKKMQSGLILFIGNDISPMNCPENGYPYRQDSSFLYFFGLDMPGIAALIDVDSDGDGVFGNDVTDEEIIWTGPLPKLEERALQAGIKETATLDHLGNRLMRAAGQGRKIHYLPPYRVETMIRIEKLLGIHHTSVRDQASKALIESVVELRSVKGKEEIYEIVLRSQETAIRSIKPDVRYRDIHLEAARLISEGLKDIGLMKGDPDEAVHTGAHALFFPHGLGHMMGLDAHDMEDLGEDDVGYDEKTERSDQFGLARLRLAKALKPGYVLTVEPGIYFIPALIEKWAAQKKCNEFIDYGKLQDYLDFGGIRIEDDVVVTEDGHRILGQAIPKTVEELENIISAGFLPVLRPEQI